MLVKITLLVITLLTSISAKSEDMEYEEITSLFKDVQALMEGPTKQCAFSGELEKFYKKLDKNKKASFASVMAKYRELEPERIHLSVKLKTLVGEFTEKYLKSIGEAKAINEICESGISKIVENGIDKCQESIELLSEHQLKLKALDDLKAHIFTSNNRLKDLIGNLGDGFEDEIRKHDPLMKLISDFERYPELQKDWMIDDYIHPFQKYIEKDLTQFVESSVDYYKNKSQGIYTDKKKDLDSANTSIQNLAFSPLILHSSKALNSRLLTRSKDLIQANRSNVLIAPNFDRPSLALEQTHESIHHELRTQDKNFSGRAIQYIADEKFLDEEIERAEEFSLNGIKTKLREHAWAQEYIDSYSLPGVSGVPRELKIRHPKNGTEVWPDQYAKEILSRKEKNVVEQCRTSAKNVSSKGLLYLQSKRRQIDEIIENIERQNDRDITHEEFLGVMTHELKGVSEKLIKINRVKSKNEDSHYFSHYLAELDEKETINPAQELATIFGIASSSVVNARDAFLSDCEALTKNVKGFQNNQARFTNIDQETPAWDYEIEEIVQEEACIHVANKLGITPKQACEEDEFLNIDPNRCYEIAEKGGFDRNICIDQLGFWKKIKDKVTSFVDSVKNAFKGLGKAAKIAWKKTKKLAKNFVKIVSHGVNGVYQLVTEGRISLDEIKRRDGFSNWFDSTLDKLDDLGSTFVEKSLSAAGNSVDFSINLHEVTLQYATGDSASAKRALKRAKSNAKDTTRDLGKAGEAAARAYYSYTIEAPLTLSLGTFDKMSGKKTLEEYKAARERVGKNLKTTGKQVGAALEVTIQPENLGKIALVYAASTVAGPFGSSLASVLYDKIVLKADMSDKDMLKSFTVGAAAGYAGEAVAGASAFKDSAYMARAVSSLTRNMTSDALNAGLGDGELTARGVLANIGKAALSVDTGDGLGSKVLDSSLQGAIDSAVDQTVGEGISLDQIDLNRARDAAINGFANGITREAVHAFIDEALIKAIPEKYHRMDKKAFAAMKEAMFQALEFLAEEQANEIDNSLRNSKDQNGIETIKILVAIENDLVTKKQNELALEIFGKPFNQLSPSEQKDQSLLNKLTDYLINNPKVNSIRSKINANLVEISPKLAAYSAATDKSGGAGGMGPLLIGAAKWLEKYRKAIAAAAVSQSTSDTKPTPVKKPKELERIHEDSIDKDQIEKISEMSTDEIVESLTGEETKPEDKLIISSDGRVWNGNHRIKVLQDRGFDTSKLIDKADSYEPIEIAPWEN
jgi:hypothetical protein